MPAIARGIDFIGEGERCRYVYKGINLYVIITDDNGDGKPHSVRFSISDQEINGNEDLLSLIHSFAEMTTIALRDEPLEYVLAKLSRRNRSKTSLPSILIDALWRWR